MSVNREMIGNLKQTLRSEIVKNKVSSFGVNLKISLYNGDTASDNEISIPVLTENNKIKGIEIVKVSLTNPSKSIVGTMNHNKKIQRTRKARR